MSALFSIVLPVFAVIGLGYWVKRRAWLSDQAENDFSWWVYYVAVPPLLFLAMAQTPATVLIQWRFLAAYVAGTVVLWGLIAMIARPWVQGFESRWLLGLGGTFSNSVYLGIPLVQTAFGWQGTQWVVLIALASNLLFVAGTAVVLGARQRARASSVLLDTLKNPLLMAIVLGLLFSASGFQIPIGIERLLSVLAQAAAPVALFALGLTLGGTAIGLNTLPGRVWGLTAAKLFAHPALVALGCWCLAVPALQAQVAILVAALPAGALAHLMAQRFGYQASAVASAVMMGTVFSLLTLTLLLSLGVFTELQ